MKKQKIKSRDYYALAAWNRSGAGKHKDKKKENRRRACRKQISQQEIQ